MSDDQIREFLVRWVMEMGNSTFDWSDPGGYNEWYANSPVGVQENRCLHKYFSLGWYSHEPHSLRTITINQAGLDFIAGGRDDQERIPG